MRSILVTGGAGYIDTHTVVELLNAGHDVTVFDNFCNSQSEALVRVERITNKKPTLIQGDIRDAAALRASHATAVIHFAGLKAVGESVQNPLAYYDNNVVGSVRLLQAMANCGVKTLVFSSSATVYGNPQRLPLTEDHPLSATNPYGQTKLVIEDMLRDLYRSDPAWRISILRYFNPVGAHASGLIGEDRHGTGVRAGQRPADTVPSGASPRQRHCHLLRRPGAGLGAVGLASRAPTGHPVLGCLALAKHQPSWIHNQRTLITGNTSE